MIEYAILKTIGYACVKYRVPIVCHDVDKISHYSS